MAEGRVHGRVRGVEDEQGGAGRDRDAGGPGLQEHQHGGHNGRKVFTHTPTCELLKVRRKFRLKNRVVPDGLVQLRIQNYTRQLAENSGGGGLRER